MPFEPLKLKKHVVDSFIRLLPISNEYTFYAMAQEINVPERLKALETNVENLTETVKKIAGEVKEVKNNLLLSSEILTQLVEQKDTERNCYKSFARFVEDSLLSMAREDADKAVLEIVDIMCKHRKMDTKKTETVKD